MFIAGVVSAGVITDITLPAGKVLNLYNKELDKTGFQTIKIIDGTNTCYVTYVQAQGKTISSSISCIK